MSSKKAVIDENNDVQNVIIADGEFEHPKHQLRDAQDVSVSPGDYWDGDKFITPKLTISGDAAVLNDGTDTASITIQQTTREAVTFDVVVAGDFTDTISISPSEQHTEELTTTASTGTVIVVEVRPEDERLDEKEHEIEVEKA